MTRDGEGYYLRMRSLVYPEGTAVLNVHARNNRAMEEVKQKLVKLKGKMTICG